MDDQDRRAVLDAINAGIAAGYGVARVTAQPPGQRYPVHLRVTAARRWVHSAAGWRLVVACHDDTPHYCDGRRCLRDWYLADPAVDLLLSDLTTQDVRLPGVPVLRGGRLA